MAVQYGINDGCLFFRLGMVNTSLLIGCCSVDLWNIYGDRQLSGAMGGDTICCADTYDRSSGGRNLDK